MVEVLDSVKRVLRHDGTLWLNIGTTLVNKQDLGIPWRLALAIQASGWWLRSEIIWEKRNPLPESMKDRPTRAHEQVFLLTKAPQYFYDALAIREPNTGDGRKRGHAITPHVTTDPTLRIRNNASWVTTTAHYDVTPDGHRTARTVWPLASEPSPPGSTHFAAMPSALVERCLRAGTSMAGCCSACASPWRRVLTKQAEKSYTYQAIGLPGEGAQRGRRQGSMGATQYGSVGWRPSCTCQAPTQPCSVLDPFAGSGTLGVVALRLNLHAICIDLSADYIALARARCTAEQPLFVQEVPHGL